MIIEHRKNPRLDTHIVLEMVSPNNAGLYHGFIQNLSEDGMGVFALDHFRVGTQVKATFNLPDSGEIICPKASVLYSRQAGDENVSTLPYMGFRFDNLSERERASIRNYIENNLLLAQ